MRSSRAAGISATFSRPSGWKIISLRRLPTSRERTLLIPPKRSFEGATMFLRRIAAALILCLLGALISMPASAADRVLRHIVMYKFKDDVTPAQLKEVIDAFAELPKKVNTIIGFEHGTNVSQEGKS